MCCFRSHITSPMAVETTPVYWLTDDRLPSNGSQVLDDGVVNGNASDDAMPAPRAASGDSDAIQSLLRLFDKLILSVVCVGLVGNTLAFSALSSRGCRGRRRRWRTHHALAILLQVCTYTVSPKKRPPFYFSNNSAEK